MKSFYHTINEYAIYSAPGKRQFFCNMQPPLRYRESRTPRKSVLPQHRPAVFYLIRKYQNSPRTGAGIGDAEQKCFCIEDISGKILHLLTLQRLPPSWLPVPWIADFYAFIIGGVFTVKLYIYSSFCVIYTVLAGLHTSFPLPILCVFHSRTDILFCCSSPLLFCCISIAFLRFGLCFGHLAVAVMLFRAVFHLMRWASLWAYVCSPSASIRLTFPFSAHKQSTTSPCTLLVSLPFRSDPMILRRKRFPTFQRQSIALCFNHHSDSLEC